VHLPTSIESLRPLTIRKRFGPRLRAEWCFFRVCVRHFRWRVAIIALVLGGGAILFRKFSGDDDLSFIRALHMSFLLVFGEAIDDFPDSRILQALLFIIPILGFTLILESVLEFSLTLRDRRRFDRSWCVMLANSYRNHVILVGLGKLGYRTFRTLHQLGEPLVVIERDAGNPFAEEVRQANVPLLTGDARRDAMLRDANVEHAASVITATSDDLANLEVALDARRINPKIRVVLRVFDQNMADKIRSGFGIGVAMSQSALSAPTFASSALAPSTVSSMVLDGKLLTIQRWTVTAGDPIAGQLIADLHRTKRIGVLRLLRDDQPSLMPDPATTLREGDELLLQGTMPDLLALRGAAG